MIQHMVHHMVCRVVSPISTQGVEQGAVHLTVHQMCSKSSVVAQDIFQSKLDSIFIGMEGVTGIADVMVIAGRDEMEHDRNFLAFMEKCMSNNLTLNSEKIHFKQSQISFHGHCWSKHGISPDPK